jgi:hypothetical protein
MAHIQIHQTRPCICQRPYWWPPIIGNQVFEQPVTIGYEYSPYPPPPTGLPIIKQFEPSSPLKKIS